LAELNNLPTGEAEERFLRCCGSRAWARAMAAARPYRDVDSIHEKSSEVWHSLAVEDRLEAFTAHPKIGDVNSLRAKYANTKAWASGEQAGVQTAGEDVLQGLATGNADYETKFGFIFIVCATGKSAGEMLALLQARLPNSREQEIVNAGAEQLKITSIRINKWLKPMENQA
jgi:2-oxo-4-hydroxy-4-carboxy-5-ureidoimidazoline decarboxylase